MAGKNSGLRLSQKNSSNSRNLQWDQNFKEEDRERIDSQRNSSRALVLKNLLSSEELFKCKREILPWKQRFRWDCGIACVAMALPPPDRHQLYKRLDFFKQHFGFRNTIWTIDLCFLLHYHHIDFRFVTSYAGVDPSLKKHAFYKSALERDRKRVLQAFADAEEKGMIISVRKIYLEEILEHLFLHGPVIVLVNSNLLRCIDCSSKLDCLSLCFCCRGFQGHYVLAIGFDLQNGWIYYNDPTYGDRTCKVTMTDFDLARTAPGTDWDAILISSSANNANAGEETEEKATN